MDDLLKRFVGKNVKVAKALAAAPEAELTGILADVSEDGILLENVKEHGNKPVLVNRRWHYSIREE